MSSSAHLPLPWRTVWPSLGSKCWRNGRMVAGEYFPPARRSTSTMKPKNTICLWFDKDAEDAARFYAATFPNSEVTAVHKAPSDYPSGKRGDVITVDRKSTRLNSSHLGIS